MNTHAAPTAPTAHAIAYACVDCYILAHDPTHIHHAPAIDYADIVHTDWTCVHCHGSADGEDGAICYECEDSGTGCGLTVGGACDMCGTRMAGYWEYHEYIA